MNERVWLALGSNLGDRLAMLQRARAELAATPGLRVLRASRIYETAPVGPGHQDDYLNAALSLDCELEPRALLERCLEIERRAGRTRDGQRWGPRRLDLDLLLFGERIVREPDLELPHPRLHERAFVLEPLREIAADALHPVLGRSVAALAREVRDETRVRLYPVPEHENGGDPWPSSPSASHR